MELLYPAQDPKALKSTLVTRRRLFPEDLRSRWSQAHARISRLNGEEILTIEGFEVMRGFEKPYMLGLAHIATTNGGRVLNVGYGLAYIDRYIEGFRDERGITEHHIIELNEELFSTAERWRDSSPHKASIFLHRGDWNDVLPCLEKKGLKFDGVVYDGFPLDPAELHRDSIPFVQDSLILKLITPRTGILTFYLDSIDGLGDSFRSLIKRLGVSQVHLERVDVQLPPVTQYWKHDYFLMPTLTGIDYSRQEAE